MSQPQPIPDKLPRIGLAAAFAAYTIWGFFPIYFKATAAVPPVELVAHRIIWSLPFGLIVLAFRKQIAETLSAFRSPATLGWLALSGFAIAFNWGIYIFAIQADRIFEASLGYYINPLAYVIAGAVFFRERLARLQIVAVGLAAIGVTVLTVSGSVFPWISLLLAFSFTLYGIIRKQVAIGAMPGLFIEICVLFLPALAYLFWLQIKGTGMFLSTAPSFDILLLFSGPLTVIPLLFFAIGARKLPLSVLGFIQFIGPTLQFSLGLYYGEAFTPAHAICFAFIWTSVAVFIVSIIRTQTPTLKPIK